MLFGNDNPRCINNDTTNSNCTQKFNRFDNLSRRPISAGANSKEDNRKYKTRTCIEHLYFIEHKYRRPLSAKHTNSKNTNIELESNNGNVNCSGTENNVKFKFIKNQSASNGKQICKASTYQNFTQTDCELEKSESYQILERNCITPTPHTHKGNIQYHIRPVSAEPISNKNEFVYTGFNDETEKSSNACLNPNGEHILNNYIEREKNDSERLTNDNLDEESNHGKDQITNNNTECGNNSEICAKETSAEVHMSCLSCLCFDPEKDALSPVRHCPKVIPVAIGNNPESNNVPQQCLVQQEDANRNCSIFYINNLSKNDNLQTSETPIQEPLINKPETDDLCPESCIDTKQCNIEISPDTEQNCKHNQSEKNFQHLCDSEPIERQSRSPCRRKILLQKQKRNCVNPSDTSLNTLSSSNSKQAASVYSCQYLQNKFKTEKKDHLTEVPVERSRSKSPFSKFKKNCVSPCSFYSLTAKSNKSSDRKSTDTVLDKVDDGNGSFLISTKREITEEDDNVKKIQCSSAISTADRNTKYSCDLVNTNVSEISKSNFEAKVVCPSDDGVHKTINSCLSDCQVSNKEISTKINIQNEDSRIVKETETAMNSKPNNCSNNISTTDANTKYSSNFINSMPAKSKSVNIGAHALCPLDGDFHRTINTADHQMSNEEVLTESNIPNNDSRNEEKTESVLNSKQDNCSNGVSFTQIAYSSNLVTSNASGIFKSDNTEPQVVCPLDGTMNKTINTCTTDHTLSKENIPTENKISNDDSRIVEKVETALNSKQDYCSNGISTTDVNTNNSPNNLNNNECIISNSENSEMQALCPLDSHIHKTIDATDNQSKEAILSNCDISNDEFETALNLEVGGINKDIDYPSETYDKTEISGRTPSRIGNDVAEETVQVQKDVRVLGKKCRSISSASQERQRFGTPISLLLYVKKKCQNKIKKMRASKNNGGSSTSFEPEATEDIDLNRTCTEGQEQQDGSCDSVTGNVCKNSVVNNQRFVDNTNTDRYTPDSTKFLSQSDYTDTELRQLTEEEMVRLESFSRLDPSTLRVIGWSSGASESMGTTQELPDTQADENICKLSRVEFKKLQEQVRDVSFNLRNRFRTSAYQKLYQQPHPTPLENATQLYRSQLAASLRAFKPKEWPPLNAQELETSYLRCKPINCQNDSNSSPTKCCSAKVRPKSVPPTALRSRTPQKRSDTPTDVRPGNFDSLNPRVLSHLLNDSITTTSYGGLPKEHSSHEREPSPPKSKDTKDDDVSTSGIESNPTDDTSSSDDEDDSDYEPDVDENRLAPELFLRPEKLDSLVLPDSAKGWRKFDFDADNYIIPVYAFANPLPDPFQDLDLRQVARLKWNWRDQTKHRTKERGVDDILDRMVELERLQIETEDWEQKRAAQINKRVSRRVMSAKNLRDRRCCSRCLQPACAGDCPEKYVQSEICELCRQQFCVKVCTETKYEQRMRQSRVDEKIQTIRSINQKYCKSCQTKHNAKFINANNIVQGRPKSCNSTYSRGQASNKPKDYRPRSDTPVSIDLFQEFDKLGIDAQQPSRPTTAKTQRPRSRNSTFPSKSFYSQRRDSLTEADKSRFKKKIQKNNKVLVRRPKTAA